MFEHIFTIFFFLIQQQAWLHKSDEGDVLPMLSSPFFNFYIPPQQYSFKVYHFNPDGLKAHNLSQWVKVKPWASSQYIKLIMAQNNTHAQPNIVYNRPSSQYIKSFFQLQCYHHWRPHH